MNFISQYNLKSLSFIALLILECVCVFSCGTIMHGTTQEIGINSQPSGASVLIDNENYGNTPIVANLSRKSNHVIQINLNGYEPYKTTLTKSVSSWVLGNILFGGLIGLAVDAVSGGIYKLTPEQITAELDNQAAGNILEDNDIFITVVLEPKSNWEKIGNLIPSEK